MITGIHKAVMTQIAGYPPFLLPNIRQLNEENSTTPHNKTKHQT